MTNKVILFERVKSNLDISSASEFGEITVVFGSGDRRCSAFNTKLYQETLLNRLNELKFERITDYICVAGSVLVISIGLITIAQAYSSFNVLLFSSTESRYVPRRFDLSEIHEMLNAQ